MNVIGRTVGVLLLAALILSGFATVPRAAQIADDGLWTAIIRMAPWEPAVGAPVLVRIPAIDVTAAVEYVGLTKDEKMENPSDWLDVGWYEKGPRPGERGSAVIAGHLDSYDGPAIFWDLKKLQPGDVIDVTDEHLAVRRFTVTSARQYEKGEAPLDEIFAKTGNDRLVLITCAGTWRRSAGYDKRYIVYAQEAGAIPPPVSFDPR